MVTKDKLAKREWTEIEPEYRAFQIAAMEDADGNRLIAEDNPDPYGNGWRIVYETMTPNGDYRGDEVESCQNEEVARQKLNELVA